MKDIILVLIRGAKKLLLRFATMAAALTTLARSRNIGYAGVVRAW